SRTPSRSAAGRSRPMPTVASPGCARSSRTRPPLPTGAVSDMRPDDLTSARRAHDDLELRLRDALHHRAQDASPQYRLDSVLERANSAPRRGVGAAAPWAIGLVAAAVVLALALVLPGLIGGPEDPEVPAGTPTPTETVPSEAPTTAPSDTAEPTTSPPTT